MWGNLKVYLAGPDVFLPDAVAAGERKKRLCADYGFKGLYPFDNEVVPDGSDTPIDQLIYRGNIEMMREADFGIANLTPFRGPSADVGTVFELGFLTGLGKPVFGYTNDPADFLDRVRHLQPLTLDADSRTLRDGASMAVENFGNADNLMIDAALAEGRHPIMRVNSPPSERFKDLTGFELCLRAAKDAFARAPGKWLPPISARDLFSRK